MEKKPLLFFETRLKTKESLFLHHVFYQGDKTVDAVFISVKLTPLLPYLFA